ncbi:hypothetical protein ZYGR_0N06320 [Zygosaccharomyces rouxii]|uniref:ZYRO0D14828p n=2 Tax=Zygosaccharomyces rouxii TaxID=4956 RepID=C5DWH2_ZYGRC|nr:uncharacterized protein ZYRO0D14828g [Zygosaccharomyces rouxii]KAH9201052.1 hypothetical protein LQ764DRAFT_234196 [Zygosaccharomyces rouxii]GAV49225.1 hypothetical protein ZYGR_0N06320 [Zygosaccharomyces rouxii]CAR28141.1 ZYRO0D14828p [Zygosaccharomyces rouxii]
MGKFEKIDDASKHVDEQLVLRGFLNSNQSLQLSESQNAKLIINTVHRLLTSLEDKNRQLENAHNTIEELKKAPKLVEIKESPQPSPKVPRVQPIQVAKPTIKNDRTAKTFQVKLNRLQSIIDELKWQLNFERNRSRRSLEPDITWNIQESIQRNEEPSPSSLEIVDQYRDEITQLKMELQKFLHDRQMISQHLDGVNRYTYSVEVLDVRPKSHSNVEKEEWSKWIEQLDKDDLELKELIQDWYEIVEIAMKVKE